MGLLRPPSPSPPPHCCTSSTRCTAACSTRTPPPPATHPRTMQPPSDRRTSLHRFHLSSSNSTGLLRPRSRPASTSDCCTSIFFFCLHRGLLDPATPSTRRDSSTRNTAAASTGATSVQSQTPRPSLTCHISTRRTLLNPAAPHRLPRVPPRIASSPGCQLGAHRFSLAATHPSDAPHSSSPRPPRPAPPPLAAAVRAARGGPGEADRGASDG